MRPTPSRIALTLASALLLGVASAQMAGQCGDCNQDGFIDQVLDPLLAAQIDLALISPTMAQLDQCDVDGDLFIGMLDALLMAQKAVGLSVAYTCPNTPPEVQNCVISDAAPDNFYIGYDLLDAESDVCSLSLEWSTDGGVTWAVGTPGPGGDGVSGLVASPSPTSYVVDWNVGADLFGVCQVIADLRITPNDGIADGISCTVIGLDVCTLIPTSPPTGR